MSNKINNKGKLYKTFCYDIFLRANNLKRQVNYKKICITWL